MLRVGRRISERRLVDTDRAESREMSFLGWPMEQGPVRKRRSQRRKKIATDLLKLFGNTFPEITYDLLWESPTINAQAWLVGSVRRVSVYGGLMRHL